MLFEDENLLPAELRDRSRRRETPIPDPITTTSAFSSDTICNPQSSVLRGLRLAEPA